MKTEAEIMTEIQACERALKENNVKLFQAVNKLDWQEIFRLIERMSFMIYRAGALRWVMDMPMTDEEEEKLFE